MAIAWIDAPGAALASAAAPVRFSATNALAFVSVSFPSDLVEPLDVAVAEEIVCRDGVFLHPYLGSTKDGSSYAIRRAGGWPPRTRPTLHVEEKVVTASAAYTPVDATAWGQWTLDPLRDGLLTRVPGRPGLVAGGVNQTGQGAMPDIVPGKNASWSSVAGSGAAVGPHYRTPGTFPAPNIAAGEHTLCGRFFVSHYNDTQTLLAILGYHPQARIAFGITGGTSSTVFTQQYNYAAVYAPGMVWPRDGMWHYASVRRAVNGDVRFGIDSTFATAAGGANVPVFTGAGADVWIGNPPGGYGLPNAANGRGLQGGMADVGAWARYLTDAEVKALGSVALGRTL